MRCLLVLSFFILFITVSLAQSNADSLYESYLYNKNDSLRIDAASRLYDEMFDEFPDSLYMILEEAVALAAEKDLPDMEIHLRIYIGQLQIRMNEYPEAHKNFLETNKLLDSYKPGLSDSLYLKFYVRIINNIAIVYFYTGKLGEAKQMFLELIDYLQGLEADSSILSLRQYYAISFQNLGSVYLRKRDYDLAETYFLKSISYINQDDKRGLSSILNNLGIVEKDRDHYAKSWDYLSRALELRYESGHLEDVVQTMNNMGNLLWKMGKTKDALDTMNKAKQIALQNNFLRSATINLESMSTIYSEMGDYKNAYLTYLEFKQKHDSLMSQETLKTITQLEIQQRFEEKMLQEEMRRKNEDLARQKKETIYLLLMITALLSLAIIVMLYALQRSKLKRHQLLAEQDKLKRKSLELENDKLNLDLEYKNKELTTNVIYLAKTNEFISSLAEKLIKSRLSFTKENQKIIDELVRELKSFSDRDTWKEFEIRFQEVHSGFYRNLLEKFPDLSANEKKLCAFLRLNMTTKEISAITYQSVNSITVARSRLRKKLGIDQDENLIAFLEQL